jgi:hypothetical protein
MRTSLGLLAVVLLFTSCSGPKPTKAKPDAAPAADGPVAGALDVGTGKDVGAALDVHPYCPPNVVGRWTMTSTFCGGMDVTQDLRTKGGISEIGLEIRDVGTICRMYLTITGPTCTETESMDYVPNPDGSSASVDASGIFTCEPAACVFNPSDAPCTIGDRADQGPLTSVRVLPGIIVTSEPPAGACQSAGVPTVMNFISPI